MSAMSAGEIHVRGAGKRYTLYEDTPTLAYGLMRAWSRTRRSKFWAAQDITFDVAPGESVGIVGRNGSGKSTLLQLLAGITAPTSGEVETCGRSAPLISVGVGFHPELTGRENIFVNGSILGLSRRDLASRVDEIVDFSGIEEFIDSPVKFYSSGMFVRLGFSVAAHTDPDILLLDEVLAVGDIAFQIKCYEHMNTLRARGTTVIIVSHNESALEAHCDRGILLERGHVSFDGPISDTISRYYEALSSSVNEDAAPGSGSVPIEPDVLELDDFTIVGPGGAPSNNFDAGDDLRLRFRVRARADINAPFLTVSILTRDGVCIVKEQNMFDPFPALRADESATWEFRCRLPFATGPYRISYNIARGNPATRQFERLADDVAVLVTSRRADFYVKGRQGALGLADVGSDFTVVSG
jgi:lipopolysaccharide transport system ATP-binding protein